MGHLVNPVAWRLGKNIYWKSTYYINNLDFAYNNFKDVSLFIFLNKFFKNKFLKFSNLFISNFKILKFFSGTFVYALFKSYSYKNKGIQKYYRRLSLNKFLIKKLLKKRSFSIRRVNKNKTFSKFKKQNSVGKKKGVYLFRFFTKRKNTIINFTDYRVDRFKKSIRNIKFISRKRAYRKISGLKKNYFLNYFSYVGNFKKKFSHIHKFEKERHIVSLALRKLRRFFIIKFSKKGRGKNFAFNTYFFKNPRRYYKNKSYFSNYRSKDLLYQSGNNIAFYDYRRFFVSNILKIFSKAFSNFSDKYTSLGKSYIFIKNKLKFKLSFYNNFIYIYRKLPIYIFVKNFLSSFVNKFFDKIKIAFIFCSESFISANLIKDFILVKMVQKFKLGKISFIVLRLLGDLCRRNVIKGFRVLLAGRFSRKDRATFYWKKTGYLSFNNKMSALDYSVGTKVLRYSLCVCKIWINN